ncbi:MAG: HD domain-containing protein [Spirochaetaceae bacterium]|nr:MAG: HD domain-containing protein [Spirochaetaceae bacterium]
MPTFKSTHSTALMDSAQLVDRIRDFAQEQLSPPRVAHVARVALLTVDLCVRFDVDADSGLLAAWGHDLAREWSHEALLSTAVKDGQPISPLEREHPVLLHGRVGALILSDRFSVSDEEVLDAVRHHTLGHRRLGTLGKVLYVADYFEPGRGFLGAATRRVIAGDDLDQMVLAAIDDVRRRGLELAEPTQQLETELQRRVTD